jgi:hypothetical protein
MKVSPDAGRTVLLTVQVTAFVPPAVVADQFVVVVLLLKSVFADPLKPTCPLDEAELV